MRLTALLTALLLSFGAAPVVAQGQFSPAITVNDGAITPYELDQRARLLTLFRTPGDTAKLAREQLIEERLKQEEIDRKGITITPENLATEVESFAARANLTPAKFATILSQNGVALTTLEQFVKVGVTWRDYIRLRYGKQAVITDAEVQRAIGTQGGGADALEVLLSEIIIAAPPPRAAEATAIANQIAQTTSQTRFEAAARQYSALPSRANGGRLNWLPLSNYPPQLQGVISGLSIGEVTAPIQIPNGVALFQMRGIRETARAAAVPTAIDYATYAIPAGDLAAAQALSNRIDTCNDLYGVAKGQPADVLTRQTVPPAQIPQDVALELARLDRDEASYNVTRNDGAVRLFVMLCSRTMGDATTDLEALRSQLQSQRLAGYADALLAELRAAATIRP